MELFDVDGVFAGIFEPAGNGPAGCLVSIIFWALVVSFFWPAVLVFFLVKLVTRSSVVAYLAATAVAVIIVINMLPISDTGTTSPVNMPDTNIAPSTAVVPDPSVSMEAPPAETPAVPPDPAPVSPVVEAPPPAAPPPAHEAPPIEEVVPVYRAYTTSTEVNVRSGPGNDYSVISTIPSYGTATGDSVFQNGWVHITAPVDGWVRQEDLG